VEEEEEEEAKKKEERRKKKENEKKEEEEKKKKKKKKLSERSQVQTSTWISAALYKQIFILSPVKFRVKGRVDVQIQMYVWVLSAVLCIRGMINSIYNT
jgi:cation transport ATPase